MNVKFPHSLVFNQGEEARGYPFLDTEGRGRWGGRGGGVDGCGPFEDFVAFGCRVVVADGGIAGFAVEGWICGGVWGWDGLVGVS